MAAATDFSDLEVGWRSVHSAVTNAGFCGFLNAVNVWIERPNVLNRRLMGALIVKKSSIEHLTGSDLEKFLFLFDAQSKYLCQGTEIEGETLHFENGGVPVSSDDKEANAPNRLVKDSDCSEELVSCIVRKLIPRSRQVHVDSKGAMFELVIVERSKHRVSFYPLSLMAPGKDGVKRYQDLLNKSQSYSLLYELPSCKEEHPRVSLQLMDAYSSTFSESNRDGVLCPTIQWLKELLLPKLCKWAEEIQDGQGSKGSLRLVPLDQYAKTYQRLKEDYGEKLVQMWPERTDPQKFVYEDIAIASYLLVLWKEERHEKNLKQKQSFVDLGCGNGLLVHILNKEGHPGTGIDLRRRKIWDLYDGNTSLQERALNPTIPGLFPDVDWLIGNHSDELTPWIPVMAARSSAMARYFVLPCCLFDFNCKFKRKSGKVTQYRGYLDFVCNVGETCGFQVEEDSLRIPSTKRICQIGRLRTFPEENGDMRNRLIKDMILKSGCNVDDGNLPETLKMKKETHCKEPIKERVLLQFISTNHITPNEHKDISSVGIHGQDLQQHANDVMTYGGRLSTQTCATKCDSDTSQQSPSSFQPRSPKEPIRNCTTLERSLKEHIVNTVARHLLCLPLTSDNLSSPSRSVSEVDKQGNCAGASASKWRKGGALEISEVAKLLGNNTLLQLKHECGGLQTLLRNHYHIFKGGVVQMRDWSQESPCPRAKKAELGKKLRRSQALRKTSMCWFYAHHPDGCPVPAEKCSYAHSTDELKERPSVEVLNSL